MTKKDIKKSGNPSPDIGDAISLTFAEEVFSINHTGIRARAIRRKPVLYA